MPKYTIGLGVALVLTGAGGYFLTGAGPATLLMGAFFGVFILVCGVMASMHEQVQKRPLYAATALAAIALLATVGQMRFLLYMMSVGPEHVPQPGAVVTRSIMAILCGLYVYASMRFLAKLPPKPAE